MAKTRANKVNKFMEYPNRFKKKNVPIMDTGTAMAGISVERKSCKKTNTTKNTNRKASINVIITLSIDAVRNKLVSTGIEILIPFGKLFIISSKETLMFLIIRQL